MGKLFIFLGLTGLVVAFQNCSDQSFASRTDLNKSSVESEQLVEEEIPETIKEDVDDVITKEEEKEEQEKEEQAKNEEEKKRDCKKDDKKEPRTYVENENDDDDDSDRNGYEVVKEVVKKRVSCKDRRDGNARFVCILAGPGKSTHVAVAGDRAIASNSTPKTACMSERACEEIVGQKMDVKSVESRGYCKNGTPQVSVLTDSEVQSLMDKLQ